MQDDPPQDEPEESQSDKSGVLGEEIEISGIDVDLSDIKSILASNIFLDEGSPSAVLETDESGNLSAKDGTFLLPSGTCDSLFLDEVITLSDVDRKELLNDVEDDPDAATMLGTANDFDLDAGLEDDIEDAFFPNKEFELDAEPNEIDLDLEESSQDELEDKDHLMPFFSLFACVILMVICAGFLISMFLGYV